MQQTGRNCILSIQYAAVINNCLINLYVNLKVSVQMKTLVEQNKALNDRVSIELINCM